MGLIETKKLEISKANKVAIDAEALPIHYATDLTKGGSLAHIQLHDQVYTLRITRAGKLILTK